MAKQFHQVARTSEVPPGRMLAVRVRGEEIALCNVGGQFFAISSVCTHEGGSLDEGELMGAIVECPRHGAQFNVKTGAVVSPPAVVPLKTYEVRVNGAAIEVALET